MPTKPSKYKTWLPRIAIALGFALITAMIAYGAATEKVATLQRWQDKHEAATIALREKYDTAAATLRREENERDKTLARIEEAVKNIRESIRELKADVRAIGRIAAVETRKKGNE